MLPFLVTINYSSTERNDLLPLEHETQHTLSVSYVRTASHASKRSHKNLRGTRKVIYLAGPFEIFDHVLSKTRKPPEHRGGSTPCKAHEEQPRHPPAQTHSPSQKLLDGGSAFAAMVRLEEEGEAAAVRGEKEARAT